MSNFLNEVSIGQAFEILSVMVKNSLKNKITPPNTFLLGSMGLGKTTIMNDMVEIIKKNSAYKKVELIDIPLSSLDDPASLMGIPYLPSDKDEDTDMLFSTPPWFPKDSETFYILFLDELTNAHPSMQHAAYRLVLNKTINNGKRLGGNVWITAAGNMKSDNTGARDLLPALANRFSVHLLIDKDRCVDEFIQYAYKKNLNNQIIGFVSFKKDALNAGYKSENAFATSRSWEFLSNNLALLDGLSEDMIKTVVCGTVGTTIGIEFCAFMSFSKFTPVWDEIRNGKEYLLPNGLGERFYVMSATAPVLSDALLHNDAIFVTHICKIISQMEIDQRVVLFRMLKSISINNMLKMIDHPDLMQLFKPISQMVK